MPSPVNGESAGVTEELTTYGRTRTRALRVDGRGLPIVLLHGFADDADTWRGVLAGLARRDRSALAVDAAGFGRADPFDAGPLLPQLDDFVDGLLATTGPAVLVGNSLGVAMSLRAAHRHPASVLGIVALDEPILSRDRLARFARGRIAPRAARALRRLPVPAPLVRRVIITGGRYLLWGRPRTADRELLAIWAAKYGTMSELSWLAEYATRFAHETVAGYPELTVACPVAVVHGARDRIIPVQASRDLHARLADSELTVLPHAGHCPQLDDPDGIAALIADFVDRKVIPPQDAVG
ncbi:alpha/beta fold hydrolase [Nocardia yamanashiensis]|uniref:alpha/beta fold hydrolase n=1 Tax=Nocardia yamanashiensis TaxID=209247 RepID=UPI000835C982|nr:alpha/beta hydrolase [Nocardia yamanashiensis]